MPSSVTITAKAGPNIQATTLLINNVSAVNFNLDGKVIQIFVGGDLYKEFDLSAATTLTCTISGSNYAFTIS